MYTQLEGRGLFSTLPFTLDRFQLSSQMRTRFTLYITRANPRRGTKNPSNLRPPSHAKLGKKSTLCAALPLYRNTEEGAAITPKREQRLAHYRLSDPKTRSNRADRNAALTRHNTVHVKATASPPRGFEMRLRTPLIPGRTPRRLITAVHSVLWLRYGRIRPTHPAEFSAGMGFVFPAQPTENHAG